MIETLPERRCTVHRIEIHWGPDSRGRYRHTRLWWKDWNPWLGWVRHEWGQVYFAPLPPGFKDDGKRVP